MKWVTDKDGNSVEKLNIFDKIDEKLTGNKVYDFYYDKIWLRICYFFYYKPKDFFHRIKLFYQRGKLGYTHEDYWSLKDSIAEYLSGVLGDWSKDVNSHPFRYSYTQWSRFIEESKKAFDVYLEMRDASKYNKKEYEKARKQIRNFFHVLGNSFEDFWD